MEQMRLDAGQLKALVQEAVAEALEQQKEIVYDAVAEALEDLALAHAIREGDRGEYVSREEILSILEGAA